MLGSPSVGSRGAPHWVSGVSAGLTVPSIRCRQDLPEWYGPCLVESMVRIQKIKASPTETTLSVEGRIVSEWVAVLEHECRQALRDTRRVQLDLAAVTFIDTRGVEVLRCLVTEGVAIVNCREFIDALLTGDQDI